MNIIDLTQRIYPSMPVYPGTEPPMIIPANTIAGDGFLEHKMTMYTHTGTHIDAPSHILPSEKNLDDFPIDSFIGKACIVDAKGKRSVTVDDLAPHRELIDAADFVLMRTGWYAYWGTETYFGRYPTLTREAASWLAGFNLKGIGVDAISVDGIDDATLPVHREFLSKNIFIIENLTELDRIDEPWFTLICLPLAVANADGSPARVVALGRNYLSPA